MPLGGLTLSELIGALSHALDITEGQAEGHCVRCCWIGMHVGRAMGLPDETLWELYYTLLLKDLGCSSNAARICELYLTDDLSFKHDFKTVNGSLPKVLKFVIGHTGLGAGLTERFKAIAQIVQHGDEIAQELIQTRCTRGADIARQLRFGDGVAAGIHSLDEHWNGGGRPKRLKGEAIPVLSRIALLAQVVDVFNVSDGMDAACWEVEDRCGSWFDPAFADQRICTLEEALAFLRNPENQSTYFVLESGEIFEMSDPEPGAQNLQLLHSIQNLQPEIDAALQSLHSPAPAPTPAPPPKPAHRPATAQPRRPGLCQPTARIPPGGDPPVAYATGVAPGTRRHAGYAPHPAAGRSRAESASAPDGAGRWRSAPPARRA